MNIKTAKRSLENLQRKKHAYSHASALLHFDGATVAPKKSAANRGETLGAIARERHALISKKRVGEVLDFVLSSKEEAGLVLYRQAELLKREYDEVSTIPKKEYVDYIKLVNRAEHIWQKAKTENDYESFAPFIDEIVAMKKRFAGYYKPDLLPYEVMLSKYEPGMDIKALDSFFATLRKDLVPLILKIKDKSESVKDDFLHGYFPAEAQQKLALFLMDVIQMDKERCALAQSLHPFTVKFGRDDVRITTNFKEDFFASSLYSVIHEGGHALYELNTSADYEFTSLGTGVSMGMHESQSRFYENNIGRSREFVNLIYPAVADAFPSISDISAEELYRAVNKSQPSFIRTEADELTYSLHVMVRYEIEKALFAGEITSRDLPEIWNEKMEQYLGIVPPDNKRGVLQDTHWSGGHFGYFPSYAVGSAYAAQIHATINKVMDIGEIVKQGKLEDILAWLAENVHTHGSLYDPAELIERCCKEKFNPAYYTKYLTDKFTEIYDL